MKNLLTFPILFFAACPVFAGAPQSLLDEARARRLHEDSHWLALGHYREGLTGIESEVDGEDFFLADDGKHDPEAELIATLHAWFDDRKDAELDVLLQCRFVARYAWLDEKLDLHSHREAPACPEYEEWFGEINPGSLTLVFPASYLNNPASMYGHTLLRIDPPEGRAELASYAVNFAARSTDTNGFLFAVKGLTGLYDGYFALLPYYRKVNEYNDIESRDIWEYPLDFTPEEIRRLLMHLWEVGPSRFEYYFFDENCSYQLLTLFEVARPGMSLTDEYFYHVIPADTVHQVVGNAGVLDGLAYRPSLETRLSSQASQLDDGQLDVALRIAEGSLALADAGLESMSPIEAAQVIDFAYLMIQYRHFEDGREQSRSAGLALPLLQRRSQIDIREVFEPVPPPDSAPHLGHGTARLLLGAGETDGRAYARYQVRAAYHDLLDPRPGFLDGAAITMFSAEGRRYEDGNDILQSIDLVKIESLSPRERLFRPLSWNLSVGAERPPFGATVAPLISTLQGGAGAAWKIGGGLLSLQLGGQVLVDDDIPGDLAWSVVPRLLYVANPYGDWNVLFEAEHIRYMNGFDGERTRVGIGQQFMLGNDIGLRFTFARERQADFSLNVDDEVSFNQADLSLLLYF